MNVDYKTKYNEALEWAKKIYPHTCGSEKEDLEHFFPEILHPSEEEKELHEKLTAAYNKGKEEATLEINATIPKWKKIRGKEYREDTASIEFVVSDKIGVLNLMRQALRIGNYFITFKDLERLPRED